MFNLNLTSSENSRRRGATLAAIGLLAIALFVSACNTKSPIAKAEDGLASLLENEGTVRQELVVARDAADDCDPEAAAAALVRAREGAAAVERDAPGAIDAAREAGEDTSDEIAVRSALAVSRIESTVAGLPSLLGQVEAAVDLAQQRLEEGACGDVEADDDDESESTIGDDDEVLVYVEVMVIDGENFPLDQFHEAGADACSDDHYHGPEVFSLEGSSMFDPAGSECGFGKTSDVTIDTIAV
ncbi:MAG TPA: hypothetical protein QF624_09150 [Dehalococcoidia bacterium]|nr:hypothetical protein [Dehalococcoidia bacterium]